MSTTDLIRKAIIRKELADSERLALTPPLLAHLAIGGHIQLSPSDRRRLSKVMLAQLAIGGFIELTKSERDSISSHALALLGMSGRTKLEAAECARIARGLRGMVESAISPIQYV
jgi:hypothetical protein